MKTDRSLITTQEAAEILDVTQGRVRQMVLPSSTGRPPILWSGKMGAKLIVVDENEVRKYKKKMESLRDAGKIRGAKPGGYKKDNPGRRR